MTQRPGILCFLSSWGRRQRRPVRLRPRLHRRLQRARLIRPLRRHQIRTGEHYNYLQGDPLLIYSVHGDPSRW